MNPIKVEVFIHSHWQTGKPIDFDIFTIDGFIETEWLKYALFTDGHIDREELAEEFFRISKSTENINWYLIQPEVETGDNNFICYFKVLELIESSTPTNSV